MEKKIRKLEAVVTRLANDRDSPSILQQLNEEVDDISPTSQEMVVDHNHQQDEISDNRQQVNHWDIVMDLDSGPGAIPGFYISRTPPAQLSSHTDIISKGIVSPERAQSYFDKYQNRLDHFPYRILCDHGSVTLESVRNTSPLLATAVCTVGALHSASEDFDLCYKEFVSLCALQTFSKNNTLDEIRALCIGAFWLGDLSWTLVGMAVRIATELQLHKSIFKALLGDRQHYLRTRLWYLVYACDHHFSVAYGRPPMTRECEAVKGVRKFLDCEHATEDDARLVSQVLRWSICSNIFDTFGVDVDRPLSDSEVPHLRRFSIALDSIRAEWVDRFIPNQHVGNYPRKGVTLQYHFAKLYLCSHVFRGFSSGQVKSRSHEVSMELEEVANAGVLAAISILRAVVADDEIQSFLDGLPIYFNVMIAFAAVFLLKVSTKFAASVQIDIQEIKRLIATLVTTLKRVTSTMHQRHLLVSITRGIDQLLQRYGLIESVAPSLPLGSPEVVVEPATEDLNWSTDPSFDPYFMGEYDFFTSQDMNLDLQFPLEPKPSSP